MRRFGFAIFCLCLMLVSCVKEEPGQNSGGQTTSPEVISPDDLREITIDVGAPTVKTSLSDTDSDGQMDDVVWQEGDEIGVWDGYANRRFVMVGEAGGTKTKFRGLIYYKATKVYAVYPYRETFITEVPPSDLEEGKLGYARLLFPNDQVQHAVEGGYDPDAAFAMAEADSPYVMTFEQKTSLLKINLGADMDDVVSVKFSGNAVSDYVWGTVSLRLIDAVTIWPGIINRRDINPLGRGKELILCNEDGSALKTGVDYYMVIPATEFERGYKVSFVHEDGTVSTRSSGNYIEYNTGTIYKLASGSITKSMFHSYYDQFMAGETLSIAGTTINKASGIGQVSLANNTLKLIESDKIETITENGIYFIRGGADVTISSMNKNQSDGIFLIGDNKYHRSPVKLSSNLKPTGKSTVLHNLNLTINESASSRGFTLEGPTNLANGSFRMENCKLTLSKQTFAFIETGRTLSYVYMKNNDVAVTVTGASAQIFGGPNVSSTVVTTVNVTENVFYHVDPTAFGASYSFVLFATGSTSEGSDFTINSCSLTYNSFVALPTRAASPSYVNAKVPHCYITRNLFYIPNLPSQGRILLNDYNGTFADNFRRNIYSVYDAINGTDTNTNKMIFDSNPATSMSGNTITEEADKQYLTRYNWCPFTNCTTDAVYATGDFKKKDDAIIFSGAGLTGDIATGTVGATRPIVIN